MTDALTDAARAGLSLIAVWLPQFIIFLLILLIGWLVAKGIAKAVDAVLERVGFDRAVERGGIKRALARSKYDASSIVSRIIYYALLLFVLQLAFGVFGPNPVNDLRTEVIAFLPGLVVAIVTVLATIGGVIVVGVGGGLIRPMQSRWERWLDTAERESAVVRAQVATSPSAQDQLRDAARRADAETRGSTATTTLPTTPPAQPPR